MFDGDVPFPSGVVPHSLASRRGLPGAVCGCFCDGFGNRSTAWLMLGRAISASSSYYPIHDMGRHAVWLCAGTTYDAAIQGDI